MFDQFASATSTSTNTPRFDKTGQTVRDRECKRFDGKLHAELTAAKTVGEWEKLADKIIKAAKVGNYRDPHGLRDSDFDALHEYFTDAQLATLTLAVAMYDALARFTVALEV